MSIAITPDIIDEHGITPEEYQRILDILGREPGITELGIFSVMWSEHCSYKNSKPLLRTFPTQGPHVLQGPGENAGIVDFDEKLALVFKIESHNHPSALEPYQGAATGVGGILRDIFTMGARPIALLDPLRFGDPKSARTRRLLSGVVEGIADYGNSVGVPTVGGECVFSPAYEGNPLINVMCLGIIEKDRITRAVASGVGNLVFYYGNATGRDGIHGATFASTELTEESEEKRSAVQVGDPFMEKKILEATLNLISAGAVEALQDMGAAGLTCSTAEMAGRGGMGITVDLDKVPQRAEGLSAYEIMLSESQERMLGICRPDKLDEVRTILQRWDLDAHVLGRLDDSGLMKVAHRGAQVACVPADKISENSPVYHREAAKPAYLATLADARTKDWAPSQPFGAEILAFLASPNICSKRWIFEQYDYMVQTQTVNPPGDNAAVLAVHGSNNCAVAKADGNGLYCYLDAYEGGKLAVAEAARAVACAGGEPLGATNCLNFGSPLKPEIFHQLSEAVRGIGDACLALGTPITGGNVSLYNENKDGAIWPTPIVGVVGRIVPPARSVKAGFPRADLAVMLLGPPAEHLGGSEYLFHRTDQTWLPCPSCDLELEQRTIALLLEANREGLLQSAQDCATGGLVVALAECLLLSHENLSLTVDLRHAATRHALAVELFAETAPRVVVSVAENARPKLEALAEKHGVATRLLGVTCESQAPVLALDAGAERVELPVADLRAAYESFPSIFAGVSEELPVHG